MKTLLMIVLIGLALNASGQEIKITVEELSEPEWLLPNLAYSEIYQRLIASDLQMDWQFLENDSVNIPFNIIVKSEAPDSLVNYGYHSFFYGMYQAYADHRPFVISPDMIWLLINQGFARHVNANSELLRKRFVNFEGKQTLVVGSYDLKLNSDVSSWEKVFPEFTEQIAKHTSKDLVELLSSDFSTTNPAEKIASQITIMEAIEPYFDFVVITAACGIPEITMKGTPEDWQKILDKTKQLSTYELEWWTKELEPVLSEFVNVAKGDIKKKFWRNMFKCHSLKKYGAPEIIDGWIVKFFPYDKDGKRNDLKKLKWQDNLPEEIVKVDLKYIEVSENSIATTPLELWAGFIGLEQNSNDFTLTPKIGWMIREKDINNLSLKQKLEADNKEGWISIRVEEIPEVLCMLKKIKYLDISFIDKIIIPDKLKEVIIEELRLSGKIDLPEIERISKMFPNTKLIINGEEIENN